MHILRKRGAVLLACFVHLGRNVNYCSEIIAAPQTLPNPKFSGGRWIRTLQTPPWWPSGHCQAVEPDRTSGGDCIVTCKSSTHTHLSALSITPMSLVQLHEKPKKNRDHQKRRSFLNINEAHQYTIFGLAVGAMCARKPTMYCFIVIGGLYTWYPPSDMPYTKVKCINPS